MQNRLHCQFIKKKYFKTHIHIIHLPIGSQTFEELVTDQLLVLTSSSNGLIVGGITSLVSLAMRGADSENQQITCQNNLGKGFGSPLLIANYCYINRFKINERKRHLL